MKGKKGMVAIWALVGVIGIALIALMLNAMGVINVGGGTASVGGSGKQQVDSQGSVLMNCPDDGDTSLKIDVHNTQNDTGKEGFDVTGYLYKIYSDGSDEYVATISDTTAPTASTIDCGFKYIFRVVSASGASGDPSVVSAVLSGDDDVETEDGNLVFFADSSNENIIIGMDQHASLNCRLYDNNQRAFVYNSVGASATDYETDGVTFTSTTDNATAMDEALGLNLQLQCKAVETDTNYNDRGILVLLEAPTATWAAPTVRVNGVKLTDIKDSGLNPDEVKAYADYEYVYLIPDSLVILDAGEGFDLDVNMELAAGVSSASVDPQIDIAPRGSVLGIDGVNVIVGTAVKDDSAKTVVHTLYDSTYDVT